MQSKSDDFDVVFAFLITFTHVFGRGNLFSLKGQIKANAIFLYS